MTDKTIAKKYQKLSERDHVLHNSDTYIGSIEMVEEEQYVMAVLNKDIKNEESDQEDNICNYNVITKEKIKIIPGLNKLFDEAIVNSRDHAVRCHYKISDGDKDTKPVTYIKVTFGENDSITVENDGNGIDVVEHPEHKLWVPEMIFGHLRTGTNYNKAEKKIVGGKNGFGVKLIFIWSTYGCIETVDHIRGLKYKQEFKNNLSEICKPKITEAKTIKPYTKITFVPDYKRMGISGLSDDFKRFLVRRTYDIAAVTDKTIKVKIGSRQISVKDFPSYVNCYIGDKQTTKRVYEMPNERWEYCVSVSKHDCFEHISFVNGIATYKGGKHVDYIVNQLTKKIADYIKHKKKVDVKPNVIKEQIQIFLRCDIENPSFSSQSKDCLDTPISKFGSTCQVSNEFAEKVAKLGIMEIACSMTEIKNKTANKRTDGTKTSNITGIPKLNDANLAGTKRSGECILILCEGDSAKAGIVSGLSTKDRDTIGVYPLRGKLKNIRGATAKDIGDNAEINDIKKILGLKVNCRFHSQEQVNAELRYGKVIFMTDQDLDGSHIKGLCINMFDVAWNDLLRYGVIGFMNTPILKATKGSGTTAKTVSFYNDGEYKEWKKTQNPIELKKWDVKYYKGLGTSTKQEFQEYFKNKKIIFFTHSGEPCETSLDMVFNKKKSNERKEWLEKYDRERYLDTNKVNIKFSEFIDSEMIHFSKYDCERSIPNVMDGLKTSQRKILYSCFLKKLFDKEIKVAQLSGYVSEKSCYHHGEQSLNEAIVSMAQNFVGSNNINLLVPNGQFGTRMGGGKDAASARYIFTLLNTTTSKIFRQEDNPVLKYLDDDGTPVEPMFYVPIIPMILINGTSGIGTGFSTDVLPHNPKDVITTLRRVIKTLKSDCELPYDCGIENVDKMMPKIMLLLEKHKDTIVKTDGDILPHFNGFTGDVCWLSTDDKSRVLIKGKYNIVSAKEIRITELPIGVWTEKYKMYVEKMIEDGKKSKKDKKPTSSNSSDSTTKKTKTKTIINDVVVKEYLDMSTDSNIDFTIRLCSGSFYDLEQESGQYTETNGIHKMFNLSTTMHLTNMNLFNAKEQLRKYDSYYDIIHDYTPVRLMYYILRKNHQQRELEDELNIISNRVKYVKLTLKGDIDLRNKKRDDIIACLKGYNLEEKEESFNYLIKMPMDSVSEENVKKLLDEHDKVVDELEKIKNTSIYGVWERELDELYDVLYSKSVEPLAEKCVIKKTKMKIKAK